MESDQIILDINDGASIFLYLQRFFPEGLTKFSLGRLEIYYQRVPLANNVCLDWIIWIRPDLFCFQPTGKSLGASDGQSRRASQLLISSLGFKIKKLADYTFVKYKFQIVFSQYDKK